MIETLRSYEASVLTTATHRNIPEDGIMKIMLYYIDLLPVRYLLLSPIPETLCATYLSGTLHHVDWLESVRARENGVDLYINSRLHCFSIALHCLLFVVIEVLLCKYNYTNAPMNIQQFIEQSSWNIRFGNDTARGSSFVN
jgi:hypothetical protein